MIPSWRLSKQPYFLSAAQVTKELRVLPNTGLSSREARRRRQEFGSNKLPKEKSYRIFTVFLDRFRDALVIILVIAAAISFFLGHVEDTILIAIAIGLDAALSFLQVWRTEKTLAAMREHVRDTSMVIRDGESQSMPSTDLVVGDIIEFRAGEKVPADARLLRAEGLRIQEAILTGESTDVHKATKQLTTKTPLASRVNMIHAGTTVMNGNGLAVVTAVGTQTEFGRIAQMLKEQKSPPSPLRRKLQKNGMQIGWIIVGAVLLLATIGLVQGNSMYDTAHTAITLIVSAIPEDLTMILTIALTVGVARILKKGGVVRKLSSGETLGAATVICTDKTGTLTEGKMRAVSFDFLQGDSMHPSEPPKHQFEELAVTTLALANTAHKSGTNSTEYFGSATERTALSFAEGAGFMKVDLKRKWRLRDDIPFSPKWKYHAILVDHPTQPTQYMLVTGAPDVLLEKSSEVLSGEDKPTRLTSAKRAELSRRIASLADEGNRLLGVAIRRNLDQPEITHDDIHDLLLLGVLLIQDTVRSDVAESIAETQSAGVAVKLITGDHMGTARAVARHVGLSVSRDMMTTGEAIQQMSDKELSDNIENLTIFSRVEPLDKQRIIRLLQQKGHVVAMTGDGVNDAVALKSADIGVAMGSGSDIAKDASDLVLLNNSFTTIVSAIKEGRVLRDNVRKVIAFLLATNAAEVAVFFVSIFTRLPLPLLPAQVLWINLVTDGTSDVALSLEKAEDDVMKRNPEDPQGSLLTKALVQQILFCGLVRTVGTMALFWYAYDYTSDSLTYARTMAFTFLATSSLLSVWSFRSLKTSMFKQGFFGNKWIFLSAGFSLFLQLLALYLPSLRQFFNTVPLGVKDWIIITVLGLVTVAIIDMRKMLFDTGIETKNSKIRIARPATASPHI